MNMDQSPSIAALERKKKKKKKKGSSRSSELRTDGVQVSRPSGVQDDKGIGEGAALNSVREQKAKGSKEGKKNETGKEDTKEKKGKNTADSRRADVEMPLDESNEQRKRKAKDGKETEEGASRATKKRKSDGMAEKTAAVAAAERERARAEEEGKVQEKAERRARKEAKAKRREEKARRKAEKDEKRSAQLVAQEETGKKRRKKPKVSTGKEEGARKQKRSREDRAFSSLEQRPAGVVSISPPSLLPPSTVEETSSSKPKRARTSTTGIAKRSEQDEPDERPPKGKSSGKRAVVDNLISASQSDSSLALATLSADRASRARPSASRNKSASAADDDQGRSNERGNKKNDKDALLMDAALLTHEEMLVKRAYEWRQLRWLAEERGLEYKTGKFTKWEEGVVDGILDDFVQENGWRKEEETLHDLIFKKRGPDERKLYTGLFERLARSLAGRPNRALRMFVRRKLTQNAYQGKWTEAEQRALEVAVDRHGQEWEKVSKVVQRSNEDCRLRWRDFNNTLQGRSGRWTKEEDAELAQAVQAVMEKDAESEKSPSTSDTRPIPWANVSKLMNHTRSRFQCMDRWSTVQRTVPVPERNWNPEEDDRTYLARLSEQGSALDKDDFSSVDLKGITDDWIQWPKKTLLRRWRFLVDHYVRGKVRSKRKAEKAEAEGQDEQEEQEEEEEQEESLTAARYDYATNFTKHLDVIKAGIERQGKLVRRVRSNRKEKVDLIDSDEEI